MSTATSSTDSWREALADVRSLLAFRRSGTTAASRRRTAMGLGLLVGITLAVLVVPATAFTGPVRDRPRVGEVVALLPSFLLVVLLLSVVSGVASAGGRELVPRDQAVAFPVSARTDHLGALLLAPLNLAWILQAWTVLGMTAYIVAPYAVPLAVVPVLLWLALATALGQVVAWGVEHLRRGPHGPWVVRGLGLGALAVAAAVVLTGSVTAVLDLSPTVWVMLAAGWAGSWETLDRFALVVGVLLLAVPSMVWLGAIPARLASTRPPRDEHRLESGLVRPRPLPASDLAMLRRLDRAAVWRSVPLRRGVLVLAVLPGLVTLAGGMGWNDAMIVPGLVASGSVLLFGVNAWALDGRGVLWRESLPVSPETAFTARLLVLLEVVAVGMAITLGLAAVRAGVPTLPQLVALVSVCLVVLLQVGSASMRWSLSRPYAVDLRSARATPAPPAVMVGYSARLALSTTLTGVLFGALASLPQTSLTLTVGLIMATISLARIVWAQRLWSEPQRRGRVVMAVAG